MMIVQHSGNLDSEGSDARIAKLVGIVNLCIASKMVAPELFPQVNHAIQEKKRDCDARFEQDLRSDEARLESSSCR